MQQLSRILPTQARIRNRFSIHVILASDLLITLNQITLDHHALHRVQLLLHTRSRVRIRIVPLRLRISHTQGHDHQLTNRRGELGHGERLSRLRAIATPHQTTEQRTRKWQKSCRPSPSGSSIPQRAERNSQTQYEAAYRGQT